MIDLRNWKLTLPIGSAGKPTEYSGAKLTALKDSDWFTRIPDGTLRFRAAVNGVTTKGSKNPRSELRELNPDGSLAGWSSSTGAHALTETVAVTRLPNPRTDGDAAVVCAQIHGSSDDVTVFRVEAGKVWVTKGNTNHHALADGNYKLGTPFEARFAVWQDKVQAFYNGKLITTITGKFSGAYFKAGAYTQANASNSKPGGSTNYGETVIYSLKVEHTATPVPVPTPSPPASPPPAPTAQKIVQIIRHGEKDDNKDGADDTAHQLSARGRERASKIAWLFTRDPIPAPGLFRPERLFASKGSTSAERMVQTLAPLAKSLKLTTSTQFDSENQAKETAAWLAAQTGVTLACLEHSAIIAVCKALGRISSGKLPTSWPDDRFDICMVFVGQPDGSWHFYQVPEMLMLPGDKTTGI